MLSPSTLQVKSPEMLFLRFLKGFCKVKQGLWKRPVKVALLRGASRVGFSPSPGHSPAPWGHFPNKPPEYRDLFILGPSLGIAQA